MERQRELSTAKHVLGPSHWAPHVTAQSIAKVAQGLARPGYVTLRMAGHDRNAPNNDFVT